MKIFKAKEVADIDQYTIEHESIESIRLMERAASKLAWWFTRYYKTNREVKIFAGPGNNGGDALALARILIQRQYRVEVFVVAPSSKLSDDCNENLQRLKKDTGSEPFMIRSRKDFPSLRNEDVIVDGIFGSGLNRPAGDLFAELIGFMNQSGAEVVSIDIPSGLFGEDNRENNADTIIRAKHTLTFQFPFRSFFFADNYPFTGDWHVLDIGLHRDIIHQIDTLYHVSDRMEIRKMLPARHKHSHKGTYGHALCIAGSYGMMGAAVLNAESALRSGAGLVTAHVPQQGVPVMQTALPEAIVSIDDSAETFSSLPEIDKYSAISIGPGIGSSEACRAAVLELMSVIRNAHRPLVIDADALNIIAGEGKYDQLLPEGSILTPHPAEFDRLAGTSATCWERHEKQIAFSRQYGVVVVLKGAYTGISIPSGEYVFNHTGNPGMATGGSGDVLTGIIVSLLAQGLSSADAAIGGVFIHGMAGDLAVKENGMEFLIAGDIIKFLGHAFNKVRSTPYLHEGRL